MPDELTPPTASSTDEATPTAPPSAWQELALLELRERREALEQEIRDLEARRDQIGKEISTSFSGQADSVARKVKGFQDYLVGALQDLAVAAEQVELVPQQVLVQPSALDTADAAAMDPEPDQAAPAMLMHAMSGSVRR